MAVTGFFYNTISIQRMAAISGSKRQEWAAVASGISAAIHPVNPELVAFQDSAFYNQFKLFCAPDTDIKIGDRLTDENNDVYTVTGLSKYDDFGGRSNEHIRCTIVKGK